MTPAALLLGQKLYHICRVSNSQMRMHQSSGNRDTEATILNLMCFIARLHEVRTSV